MKYSFPTFRTHLVAVFLSLNTMSVSLEAQLIQNCQFLPDSPENAELSAKWESPQLAKQVLSGNYLHTEDAPVINSSENAIGTLGAPFTYTISATNNPVNFSVEELPDGFSFNNSTGVITGLPTEIGQYAIKISASNLTGMDTLTVALTIIEDPFVPFIHSVPEVIEQIRSTNTTVNSTPVTIDEFTFSSRNGMNTVYAIMAYPQTEGTYPGIMFLHGGGGNAETMLNYVRNFASQGYSTIAIDLPGLCGKDNTPYSDGPWKSRPAGEGPRFDVGIGAGNSTLVDAEVAAMEAFNLLQTQVNVDSSRMGVSGISWGGYSTTMVTGLLGNKVKAAYAIYGCGFYEKGSFWKEIIAELPDENRKTWLTYLDAGRRAPGITAPYFIEAPTNDTYFWPEAVMSTLDAIPGQKNHVWGPNLNHTKISSNYSMMTNFFKYHLKNEGHPFPAVIISDAYLNPDSSAHVQLEMQIPDGVFSLGALLYYSMPSLNWQTRVWESILPEKEPANTYSATIPASIVKQNADFFGYVKDSKSNFASTFMLNTKDLEIKPTTELINRMAKSCSLKLYPNPNSGSFSIVKDNNSNENYHIILYDNHGRRVFEEKKQYSGNVHINCPGLLPGIYTLKISSDMGLHSEKIVIY